jgi:hypothetical protein
MGTSAGDEGVGDTVNVVVYVKDVGIVGGVVMSVV